MYLKKIAERTKEKEVRKIIEQEKTLSYEDAKALYLRKIANIKNDYSILLRAREDSYQYLLKKTEEEKQLKMKIIESIIHS